ncbi:MAG: hypothetical protein R3257_04425, partial [bacterium]|nr:hypothetical protein [bacterium]
LIRGCPPLRSKTNAAFHVMTYQGKMTIAATCAPTSFSLEDTEKLLSAYVAHLRQSLKTLNETARSRRAMGT